LIKSIIQNFFNRIRQMGTTRNEETTQGSSSSVVHESKEESDGRPQKPIGGASPIPIPGSSLAAKSVEEVSADVSPEKIPAPRPRRRRPRRRPGGNGKGGFSPSGKPSVAGGNGEAVDGPCTDEALAADDWDISRFEIPRIEEKTRFHDLDLPLEIMHAIHTLDYQYCTPIQAELLPKVLSGIDATGRAQTGTGKTAVFLISIITRLLRTPSPEDRHRGTPRALILAPTRELAMQIEQNAKELSRYTRLKIVAVYGGMDYGKQKQMLTNGMVDIVVATPGRLLDFKQQGDLHLGKVETLVIDEADRMLDMGFIPDVRRIVRSTPPKAMRQTMLFSATLTPEVTQLTSEWTMDPAVVEIDREQVAVDTVEQIVYITTMEEKFSLLYNMITLQGLDRVIVFTNRRDQARRLNDQFKSYGISCSLLSGEVEQSKRIRTLEDFRAGKIRIMVATDVAARGLHVDGISHVVNYYLPQDPEDYVHRIGRTGRAGASGMSVSFASEDDSFYIPGIEKFIGRELHCVHPEEEWLKEPPPPIHGTTYSAPPRRAQHPSPRPHRQNGHTRNGRR